MWERAKFGVSTFWSLGTQAERHLGDKRREGCQQAHLDRGCA